MTWARMTSHHWRDYIIAPLAERDPRAVIVVPTQDPARAPHVLALRAWIRRWGTPHLLALRVVIDDRADYKRIAVAVHLPNEDYARALRRDAFAICLLSNPITATDITTRAADRGRL